MVSIFSRIQAEDKESYMLIEQNYLDVKLPQVKGEQVWVELTILEISCPKKNQNKK
jgi:hypothetical protein